MFKLLRVFVDIALWRRGPQHLPPSLLLLGVAALVSFAVKMLLSGPAEQVLVPGGERLPAQTPVDHLVAVALTLAWVAVMLVLVRKPKRFVQTSTALFAVAIVIEPLGVLAPLAAQRLGAAMLTLPLIVASLCWYVLAVSHVVASALEVSLLAAVLLTFGFMMIELLVAYQLHAVP